MSAKKVLLLLFTLLFFLRAQAQELNATLYDINNVLPSSSVYALHQDNHGNLWIANGIGVCKYDGYTFTCFDEQDGIPSLIVLKFFPQKNGDIWGTCFNQDLFYFNGNFQGFHVFPFNDSLKSYLHPNAQIKSITVDELGVVHIGGWIIPPNFHIDMNGNVDHFKTKNAEINYLCLRGDHFFVAPSLTSHVEKSTFVHLDKPSKSVHLGGVRLNDSTAIFMANNTIIMKVNNDVKSIQSDKTPILLRKLNDSLFAVGYYKGGVVVFNEVGESKIHMMKDKSVSDLLIDQREGYWFANLFEGLRYVENIEVRSCLKDEIISDLEKDLNENLFIGCRSGKIFKREKGEIEPFYLPEKRGSSGLFFYRMADTSFHIISSGHEIDLNGQKRFRVPPLGRIAEYVIEEQDDFSYRTWPYRIQDSNFFNKIPRAMDVAQYGRNFYIATVNKNGLIKYNGDTIISLSQKTDLLSFRVNEINLPYGKNIAYLGTSGAGLAILSESGLIKIGEKEGLSSNYVNKVYVENDSTIWVGTNKGINAILFNGDNEYTIKLLNNEQGLNTNDVMDVIVLNDTVWVGTKSGLSYFPKKILLEKSSTELFFRLTHVLQNEDTLMDNVELSYHQNTLTFYVTSVSFDRNERIIYHYRIKEIDEAWRTTKNREIVFQSLNPGAYTFEAKVELDGYFPDESVQFNFTINPPFWHTWWFYLLYVFAGGLLVYLFFKIRVLTYNKDVVRELMRQVLKRVKREEHSFVVRTNGEDVKIIAETVLYVKSAGNYLELFTTKEKHVIRGKISTFIDQTTDPLEYLRVHRSYVIRIDQVDKKGKNWVVINDEKIPVGESYLEALKEIHF